MKQKAQYVMKLTDRCERKIDLSAMARGPGAMTMGRDLDVKARVQGAQEKAPSGTHEKQAKLGMMKTVHELVMYVYLQKTDRNA